MSKLTLLTFPDPRLRKIAKQVTTFDKNLEDIVESMINTMYAESGIGLAATQVNIQKRIITIDLGDKECDVDKGQDLEIEKESNKNDSSNLIVLINPEIENKSDDTITYQEGCLSVPEIYADVRRAKSITISAYDIKGERFNMDCDDLLSVCIQHEIDHLNGKLFVDYLSLTKRNLIRDKLKKTKK